MWGKKKKRNQVGFIGATLLVGGRGLRWGWGYSKVSGQYDFFVRVE